MSDWREWEPSPPLPVEGGIAARSKRGAIGRTWWSQRFIEKTNKVPTMIHAGTYGAVTHYLKAVAAAGVTDGPLVAAKMREMPVNDFMTGNGRIREDGRLVRDMYLFRVKSPEESKYKFDYYELLATIPGNEAFKPLEEGGCPLLSKK